MTWDTVLDLSGSISRLDAGRWTEVEKPENLSGNISLVTDYQGARFGVESFTGKETAYAPIIEKQLRDEGVIDDLAEVIVHSAERMGGYTRVLYTVVPSQVMQKYQEWARQYRDFLFFFTLASVLFRFARKSGLKDGAILFAHGRQIAVLAFRAGQIVAADSLHHAGRLQEDGERIAKRVWAMCQENPTDSRSGSLRFVVAFENGLVHAEADQLCAAIEEYTSAFSGSEVTVDRIVDCAVLFTDLPSDIAHIPALDRTLYLCSKGVPWLAVIMAVGLIATLVSGWHWHAKRDALIEGFQEKKLEIERSGLPQSLTTAAQDAEQMSPELQRVGKILDAREHARLIPPLQELLVDIREAAGEQVRVAMVGAVSSDDGGLISITFNGVSLDSSFESERAFIRGLEGRGYKVVKREVDTSASGSMFKLSIIRSQ